MCIRKKKQEPPKEDPELPKDVTCEQMRTTVTKTDGLTGDEDVTQATAATSKKPTMSVTQDTSKKQKTDSTHDVWPADMSEEDKKKWKEIMKKCRAMKPREFPETSRQVSSIL